MLRHLMAAITAMLFVLAIAGTAAASGLGTPTDDQVQQSQVAGQSAGNKASNEQESIVVGSQNVQVGANNNTVQLGAENESNGNTNTAGDQTAVNGNNFQQSNEQDIDQEQESSGGSRDSGSTRQSQAAGQGAKNDAPSTRGHCGCPEPGNDQDSFVFRSNNVQVGANNNTLQFGHENESNGNTNTAGDQTAVNGNNFQQSNEQDIEQDQRSGDAENHKSSHGSHGAASREGDGHADRDGTRQSQAAAQGARNRASNEQEAIVIGSNNVQIGANNNTLQFGAENESNDNTNTAGDQTAVNGNNFQQSNEQNIDQEQESSRGSNDFRKKHGCFDRCEPKPCGCEPKPCGCEPKPCGCEPNHEPKPCDCKRPKHGGAESTRQSQRAGQWASNRGSNEQWSFVWRSYNTQVGGNNNTIQGSGKRGENGPESTSSFNGDGDNESNGNTNTAGDQTAVNGNNFQQTNEQTIDQSQRVGDGKGDHGRPEPRPVPVLV